jgi:hypothetical protein
MVAEAWEEMSWLAQEEEADRFVSFCMISKRYEYQLLPIIRTVLVQVELT